MIEDSTGQRAENDTRELAGDDSLHVYSLISIDCIIIGYQIYPEETLVIPLQPSYHSAQEDGESNNNVEEKNNAGKFSHATSFLDSILSIPSLLYWVH